MSLRPHVAQNAWPGPPQQHGSRKKSQEWVPENPSTNLPTEKRSDDILATFDPALSPTSHVAT